MKLSEAIREGAKKRPQTRSQFFSFQLDQQGNDICSGSCALGAAFEACAGRTTDPYATFGTIQSEIFGAIQDCTDADLSALISDDGSVRPLWGAIAFRNDHMKMTREQIADWLAEQGL